MDHGAGVGSLHADCTSTSQLASYATGLSTDSPRTSGVASLDLMLGHTFYNRPCL